MYVKQSSGLTSGKMDRLSEQLKEEEGKKNEFDVDQERTLLHDRNDGRGFVNEMFRA